MVICKKNETCEGRLLTILSANEISFYLRDDTFIFNISNRKSLMSQE